MIINEINNKKIKELEEKYRSGRVGDVEVKQYLIAILNNFLDPIREKRAYYENNKSLVKNIMYQGTQNGRDVVQKTMVEVRKAMKLINLV